MSHMQPLAPDLHPELQKSFQTFIDILGFVPNSLLTMQRKPAIVQGFEALTKAVMDPAGEVDPGFKRLLAHFCSRASGCQYCMAHTLIAANLKGIPQNKIDALWEYQTSDLYNDAERAALDFAIAAGSVPNSVDADIFARMRAHWSENQIVEMLGAISLYGFLNRWNDSMATTLEQPAIEMGQHALSNTWWNGGKHLQS